MAPLKADLEVTGHPVLDVWVSSNQPETNLFAYLEDVAPDGKVVAITDARQQLSTRKEHQPPWRFLGLPWRRAFAEDHEPLKPGEAVRVRVDFLPVSYVFKAGHRIQVTVAGADYRERGRAEAPTAPVLTVYGGGERASALSLPTVGAGA
jgi:putative CocE/NonD family hydrolase